MEAKESIVARTGVFVLKGRDGVWKISVHVAAGSVCISVLPATLGNSVHLPCLVHLGNFKVPFFDRLDFFFSCPGISYFNCTSGSRHDLPPSLLLIFLEFSFRPMKTKQLEAGKA